jgi:hypothetical protein
MGLAHKSVKSAVLVGPRFSNYESEGRTFESFRARHFGNTLSALNAADSRRLDRPHPTQPTCGSREFAERDLRISFR